MRNNPFISWKRHLAIFFMNNNLSIIFRKSTKISDLNSKEMETGLGNLERDKLIFEVPGDESKNLY